MGEIYRLGHGSRRGSASRISYTLQGAAHTGWVERSCTRRDPDRCHSNILAIEDAVTYPLHAGSSSVCATYVAFGSTWGCALMMASSALLIVCPTVNSHE